MHNLSTSWPVSVLKRFSSSKARHAKSVSFIVLNLPVGVFLEITPYFMYPLLTKITANGFMAYSAWVNNHC